MGTDRYPDLPTREQMAQWLAYRLGAEAPTLLDSYTARVIAEHRDTEQGCCHCGIPGRHYTSDHTSAEPPPKRGRRCIMCGERGKHTAGCGNTGWS